MTIQEQIANLKDIANFHRHNYTGDAESIEDAADTMEKLRLALEELRDLPANTDRDTLLGFAGAVHGIARDALS